MKAAFAGLFELGAEFFDIDEIGEADMEGTIDEGKRGAGLAEMLPDELEHEEFVEIGVEQGAGDGIEVPIVIVSAAREVDDHGGV